jgi:Flp pilus assembly protein TadD
MAHREEAVRPWLAVASIVGATFAVYANAFGNAFVWDDLPLIVDNPRIKSWSALPVLLSSNLFAGGVLSSYYRPFQGLTYLVDYQLWGLAPAGFHLTATALHATTAVLLYRLGAVLFGDARAALAGALLFAVHPVHTEAVTYLAGRSDPLSALALLAALLAHVRGRTLLATAAFAAALLAREAAVGLVPLLVVVDLAVGRRPSARRLLPYVAILAVYLAVRVAVVGATPVPVPADAIPLWRRALTMLPVVADYLRLLVVPTGLHMERLVPAATSPLEPRVLASAALLIALVAAAIALRRRAWPVAFAAGWFLVALLPVANLVPLATFMAEHWLYVPSMGPFLAAGYGLSRLATPIGTRGATAIGAALVLVYGGLTIRRNHDWGDARTLFESTVRLSPGSTRAHANLGLAYEEAGERDRARVEYERAIVLAGAAPESAGPHNNLGNLLREDGRLADAERELRAALAADPRHAGAHGNLALVLQATGRTDEAERVLLDGIALAPDAATLHSNLGNVYFRRDDLPHALAAYQQAVALDPEHADAHNNLGSVLFRLGRLEEAERQYRIALSLKPDSAAIRQNLSVVLRNHAAAAP